MTLVRRLARPLIAAPVIAAGLDALRHPGPKVDAVRPLVGKVSSTLNVPDRPETYLRASGAGQVGAGLLFATGKLPRLSALVMALTMVPTGPTQHAFWTEQDPEAKRASKAAFLTWLGLLGAALLAAVDTQGRPGLAWRSKHAAQHLGAGAHRARKDADAALSHAGRGARRKAAKARAKAEDLLPG
ncbi:MAG: DoxX family protein [Kineosporiaceae bacterium]